MCILHPQVVLLLQNHIVIVRDTGQGLRRSQHTFLPRNMKKHMKKTKTFDLSPGDVNANKSITDKYF